MRQAEEQQKQFNGLAYPRRFPVAINSNSLSVGTEAFVVCQNYQLPKGFTPDMSRPLLDFPHDDLKDDMRVIAPFVAAGDLS